MFEHILVPLDGSELAESALPLAVAVAEGLGSQLRLVRMVPYFAVLAADPLLYDEINRLSEEEALAYLRDVAQRLPASVKTDVVAEIGSAAEGILDEAKRSKAGLIVISSHGRSGINRWVFGSVAERVLSQSPVPAIIVNARCGPWDDAPKKILVPLDGSELAEQALGPAREMAKALQAELHLLRVTTSAHIRMETPSMAEVFADLEVKEVTDAEQYLQHTAPAVGTFGLVTATVMAEDGIADAIMDYAAREDIDLIVMSSHGRSGISRWVYGSVAEKVLRGACCATMVVR
jgi:nucleotide-binding universal stress UspA family protein